MTHPYNAVYQISTEVVAASGVGAYNIVQSNTVYKDVTLGIKPLDIDTVIHQVRYNVNVFLDGELLESHSFPTDDDRVICLLSYPRMLFPPNISTNTIPRFHAVGASSNPIGISLRIHNLENTQRPFQIWSTFEQAECSKAWITTSED